MDLLDDVYEYDKSVFFKLLESDKFRSRFEWVQEQQGIVVCPIDIRTRPFNSVDLIEKHLFLPSPFYKNRFEPLVSATSNNLAGSRLSATSTAAVNNVNLIYNDGITNGLNLVCNGQPICTNVKHLKTETAYSAINSRPYKILVVDRELIYGDIKPPDYSSEEPTIDLDEPASTSATDSTNRNKVGANLKRGGSSASLSTAVVARSSPVNTHTTTMSLKDVCTFSKAIDFLHNAVCTVDESLLNGSSTNGIKNRKNSLKRSVKVSLGETYLDEIELFKKTYIILYTHLDDYKTQAQKLYTKYAMLFGHSHLIEQQIDEALVCLACEIALNGCMFSKLWPAVLKANEREDTRICNRINLIRIRLGLTAAAAEEDLDEPTIEQCVSHFHLDRIYFGVNVRPILKEMRKLELLNNPFERLECIKASVDLLVNELTVVSMHKQKSAAPLMVTSENLIPMMAFILVRSTLTHLKSIVYFIDQFSFSDGLRSGANSYLAELDYFLTTFKASITFIEDS